MINLKKVTYGTFLALSALVFTGTQATGFSCIGENVGIQTPNVLLTNEICPIDENCEADLCGTLTLTGCEVDVKGRLVARNIKLLAPDENGECECELEVGDCSNERGNSTSLERILQSSADKGIDDLARVVIDLVEVVKMQQQEIQALKQASNS